MQHNNNIHERHFPRGYRSRKKSNHVKIMRYFEIRFWVIYGLFESFPRLRKYRRNTYKSKLLLLKYENKNDLKKWRLLLVDLNNSPRIFRRLLPSGTTRNINNSPDSSNIIVVPQEQLDNSNNMSRNLVTFYLNINKNI